MIDISKIVEEIRELNKDGKSISERTLKFSEEYGEMCAEICKFVGISHKPKDKDHLIEEGADALQSLISILLHLEKDYGISLENNILPMIIEKNKKWRECQKNYTINKV